MDDTAGGPTCRSLAEELPGAFHGRPVVPGSNGWETMAVALEPERFARHVAVAEHRWRTDDTVVALSLLVRELTVAATTAAVTPFARDRRLLDVSMRNLACRQSDTVATIGLLASDLTVLPGDDLEGRPGVATVPDADAMAALLAAGLLDQVVPQIIDAARAHTRVGARHLWGNVALAIVNTLTTIGHRAGPRTDGDRDALLAARPELAPTIELISVPDGVAGPSAPVNFAIRRTCCLLDRVPGAFRCGTCSLNDHDETVRLVARHYLAERRASYGAWR